MIYIRFLSPVVTTVRFDNLTGYGHYCPLVNHDALTALLRPTSSRTKRTLPSPLSYHLSDFFIVFHRFKFSSSRSIFLAAVSYSSDCLLFFSFEDPDTCQVLVGADHGSDSCEYLQVNASTRGYL
jgi:hypothetical protein